MIEKSTREEWEQKIRARVKESAEARQTDEFQKEAEESYRKIFKNANEAIFVAQDSRLVLLNPMTTAIIGYSPEELESKPFIEFIHPDDRGMVMDWYIRRMKGEDIPFRYSFRIIHRNGHIKWVELIAIKIEWREEAATLNFLTDITEHKQAERLLLESEGKYRDLYDSAPDMFVSVDSKTAKIIECNQTLTNALGYTKEEIIGRLIFDMYTPGSAEYAKANVFPVFMKTGSIQGEELQLQRKDGSKIDVSLNVTAVRDEKGNILYSRSVWRDITKKKKLEKQLQQSQKTESVGTLAGGIAHDFNNILFMITGNTELALEDIPEWNPVHANLEEIKAAALRAAGIVKQLLNFTRKTDRELKPIGAITVIKDTLKFLRSTISTTIEIRKHLPGTEVTILADPIQINQVLMNICTNASQAMEETGGILEITVENVTLGDEAVDSYPDLTAGDYIKTTISDTGPGIEPEIIDRIFDPYFTTKEVGKNSGMGLAVVLGIVKNHNGAISVASEPGKGTTFTILFQVLAEKPVMEAKTPNEIPRGNETILIAK